MCDMSDRLDLCRMATELSTAQIAKRVKQITSTRLYQGTCYYEKDPYNRAKPAPQVRPQLA